MLKIFEAKSFFAFLRELPKAGHEVLGAIFTVGGKSSPEKEASTEAGRAKRCSVSLNVTV